VIRCRARAGFTLIELLIVVSIIALLVSILAPSLGSARDAAGMVLCANHQRNLAIGWNLYCLDNRDVALPGRFGANGEGTDTYWVGNGMKYRPRWVAGMGVLTGAIPFANPSPTKANGGDRQDYANEVYKCPAVPERIDERNYAYGYNYQFLGNARNSAKGSGYRNFPVLIGSIRALSSTVMAGDSMGTAAAFPALERTPYSNDGSDARSLSNHGWSLDPPRLTAGSDRGPGETPGDPRIAVDPRHRGKVTVSFCDGHVNSLLPEELGYDVAPDGRFTDAGNNRMFSPRGDDADPPPVWQ